MLHGLRRGILVKRAIEHSDASDRDWVRVGRVAPGSRYR